MPLTSQTKRQTDTKT